MQDAVDGQRVVGEAMHLFQLQLGAIEVYCHHPAGLGANIDGKNGGAFACHVWSRSVFL